MPRTLGPTRSTAILLLALTFAACSSGGTASGAPDGVASAAPREAPTAAPVTPAPTTAPSTAPSTEGQPSPTIEATPRPRPSLDVDLEEVAAYLTAAITILDLSEEDLAVDVLYLDSSGGAPFPVGTYTVNSQEQSTNAVPPGIYELTFRQPSSAASGATCTIEVGETDGYIFAALGDAIAVTRTGVTPTDAAELFVATSSLCDAGGAS